MDGDKFVNLVLEWAKDNLREFPWRQDRTPYRVLVAEFLLKRTTATAAEGVYEDFISRFPDIKGLSEADRDKLEGLLSNVGLQRQRAEGMLGASNYIRDEYGGNIPEERAELLKIPHVGPYTADSVLSLGVGEKAGMLDSNVKRVLGRAHSSGGSLKREGLKELADSYAPPKTHALYNLGVIDIGSLICRYDEPRCAQCPLKGTCEGWSDKGDS